MRTPCIKFISSHALFVLHMALMGVEAYKYGVEFEFDTVRIRTSSWVVLKLAPTFTHFESGLVPRLFPD